MPYKTFATNDVLTAADMNAITADSSTADIATLESSTSTTYADLTTVGPQITGYNLVNGQQAMVIIQARAKHSAAGGQSAFMSFTTSGAVVTSALDANGAETDATTTAGTHVSRVTFVTATSTAALTATMKYKVVGGGTGSWNNRRIVVKKY